jgi:hypothetical protein
MIIQCAENIERKVNDIIESHKDISFVLDNASLVHVCGSRAAFCVLSSTSGTELKWFDGTKKQVDGL